MGMTGRRTFASEPSLLLAGAAISLLALLTPATWSSSGGAPSLPFGGDGGSGAGAGSEIERDYGRLPLSFVPNAGMTDPGVDFLSRGQGYSLFLSPTEATLALRRGESGGTAIRMRLQGADPTATAVGENRLPGTVNYLRGSDRSEWATGVPTYGDVSYGSVYEGIDVRYYGRQGQLEYDFELAPGADPRQIGLRFEGAREVSAAPNGDLLLSIPGGTLRERAPIAYQRIGGERRPVDARYVLDGRQVGFEVGRYDRARPLTIDPLLLAYSTYLGGAGTQDYASGIAVDSAGAAYVAGSTDSADFPTTAGAFDTALGGSDDAYVIKLAPDGESAAYSTYLGGTSSDGANGLGVDASGSAYVTGSTDSSDFPITPGAADPTFAFGEAFVTKLTPSGGGLAYSTFLGGSCNCGPESGFGIAVDSAGGAYVTGTTASVDFPTTPGAFDTTLDNNDAFVTKVAPSGAGFDYSTFLGGASIDRGHAVAVDPAGAAYVTGWTSSGGFPVTGGAFDVTFGGGQDGFVTKLAAIGDSLAYSTFLGGNNDTSGFVYDEEGTGIAVDPAGSAYVSGDTPANDFPTTAGAFDTTLSGPNDAVVAKLAANGGSLGYSTYLGGGGEDFAGEIVVDPSNRAVLTGTTRSSDFPTTACTLDEKLGGTQDAFVTEVASDGESLGCSTYFGGGGFENGAVIDLDSAGQAYVGGVTGSSDFTTTPGAFDTTLGGGGDGFVTKICRRGPRPGDHGDGRRCRIRN